MEIHINTVPFGMLQKLIWASMAEAYRTTDIEILSIQFDDPEWDFIDYDGKMEFVKITYKMGKCEDCFADDRGVHPYILEWLYTDGTFCGGMRLDQKQDKKS